MTPAENLLTTSGTNGGDQMARASKLEQLMLQLVNGAREKAGLRALKFEGHLNQAAEDHSEWMIRTDIFSHTGAGGSSATDRIKDSGYRLGSSWATGENIVAVPNNHNGTLRDEIRQAFQLWMNSDGHRANILSGNFRETGIGVETGKFNFRGTIADAVVITQDFARSSARQTQSVPMLEAPSRDSLIDTTDPNSHALSRFQDDFLF